MLLSLKGSVLFTREKTAASAGEVIAWWEARRPIYNLVVGSAGLFSCMVAAVDVVATQYFHIGDAGLPNPPIFVFLGIFFYGFAANLCYAGGWLAELAARKFTPAQSERLAILSFKFGLAFAVFLTLFPGIVFGAFGLIAAWPHILGNGQR